MPRNTNKYHFKKGNLIVHTGIADDLDRREREHRAVVDSGHISKVGLKVTRESALDWEREQALQGKPTRGYRTEPTPMKPKSRRM